VTHKTIDLWEAASENNGSTTNVFAPPDVRVKVPKQEQVKAAERVLDSGESTAQVAADLGVTEQSVRSYRRKEEKRREKEAIIEATPVPVALGAYALDQAYVCGIADLDLPAESVDLIVTDPPYHDEHVNSYAELARLARAVLKPGCFACVYAGKLRMPQVIAALSEHLEYVWTIAVFHPFSKEKHLGQPYNFFENWRPVLVYKVPGVPPVCNAQQDVVRGERDKAEHDWQQDLATPLQLIASYTDAGGIVLDPFCGGGTTARAARDLDRHFLAFDIEPHAVKTTMARCFGG
jgi:site-specific DNA-methyltransferase (adenine-specific)